MKKSKSHPVRFPTQLTRGGKCRRLTFAAGIAGSLLMLGAGSAQDLQPETPKSVRGTVVNSVTHEPIGRALVFSPDNRFATLTDSEGHFEFTVPAPAAAGEGGSAGKLIRTEPAGQVSLMARKPGFLDDRGRGAIPGTPGKELTISLVPEALIVGHVVLPSSEAPDRIQVELYRHQVQDGRAHWIMQRQATTKSTGEFRFAELLAGSYKLLTRELLDRDPLTFDPRGPQFGYPPVYFPGAGDFVTAETIQLSAGTTFQADITLVKQPYYPVKVAVTNPQPGFGMQVVVSPLGHRGPGYALGVGRDTIEGLLPNGTYTVEAASVGTSSASGSLSITVKGARAEGASLTLVPESTIGVNVKEEFPNPENAGEQGVVIYSGPTRAPGTRILSGPRRYLNIRLEPVDDFGLGQGATLRPATGPDDDALVIDNVRPGRYWVKLNSSRGFASAITSGGVDLQHQPLVVSGGSSPPIEVTMRDDWAEADGTVEGLASPFGETDASPFQTGMSFETAAHVYFVPLPDSSGEFHEAWAGRDGKFNVRQIPPGAYRVLAFDREQPELEYRNAEAMRAYDSKGQVVSFVGNQKEQVRLQVISTSE